MSTRLATLAALAALALHAAAVHAAALLAGADTADERTRPTCTSRGRCAQQPARPVDARVRDACSNRRACKQAPQPTTVGDAGPADADVTTAVLPSWCRPGTGRRSSSLCLV